MRESSTNRPSRMAAIASNIPLMDKSVKNPSRPWLMPTSATSKGASVRAILSMVPSPPMTMASFASRPSSSSCSTGYSLWPMCVAVSGSSSTRMPRFRRNCASRKTGSAISGLLYLPINATLLNVFDMRRIRAHLPIALPRNPADPVADGVECAHEQQRILSQRTRSTASEDAG